MHTFFTGLLLGYGAAVPIGPMNVEITRRNLSFGTPYGISFGLGACSADLIYLVLVAVGALTLLQHPMTMRIVGLVGALILAWFGISALRMKPLRAVLKPKIPPSYFKNYTQGLLLTIVNPITILFWASVSSHLVIASDLHHHLLIIAGAGVSCATVSWILFINGVLHKTRHKLSDNLIHKLNVFGGVILLIFAMMGLFESLVG